MNQHVSKLINRFSKLEIIQDKRSDAMQANVKKVIKKLYKKMNITKRTKWNLYMKQQLIKAEEMNVVE